MALVTKRGTCTNGTDGIWMDRFVGPSVPNPPPAQAAVLALSLSPIDPLLPSPNFLGRRRLHARSPWLESFCPTAEPRPVVVVVSLGLLGTRRNRPLVTGAAEKANRGRRKGILWRSCHQARRKSGSAAGVVCVT